MVSPHLGESRSFWMDDTGFPHFSSLDDHKVADVCVIGAGLGGILTAYLCQKAGYRVVVLEEARLGQGQTARTTAHFSNAFDDRYFEMEKVHGLENSRLIAASHTAALELTLQLVQEERIDCGFLVVDGFLFRDPSSSENILRLELEACHRAGLVEVSLRPQGPYSFFLTGECLCFPRQIQLHPLKYLRGLVQAFVINQGRIFEESRVVRIRRGAIATVETASGRRVRARHVVVATNSPINDRFTIHSKQEPYRTYAISFSVPRGSVPSVLCWDTANPYHYVRLGGEESLMVGGGDHRTGENSDSERSFLEIEEWTRRRFPMAGTVEDRWSGQVMEPIDGLAYLGKNPGDENIYVISGDSGNGMTHCTIGALIIRDLIQRRANPWVALYDPSRISIRRAGRYLQANLRNLSSWARRFDFLDGSAFAGIPSGQGRVIQYHGRKIAAYRDERGELSYFSAICPHMGCLVTWNAVEKTWDCPCHGSRFDNRGQVIEGPAVRDIARRRDIGA